MIALINKFTIYAYFSIIYVHVLCVFSMSLGWA